MVELQSTREHAGTHRHTDACTVHVFANVTFAILATCVFHEVQMILTGWVTSVLRSQDNYFASFISNHDLLIGEIGVIVTAKIGNIVVWAT